MVHDVVDRRLLEARLGDLLEPRLGVDDALRTEPALELAVHEGQQHVPRSVETAVEVHRADERLERARQQGGAVAATTARLAPAEHQVWAETQLSGPASECRLAHQPGAQNGQLAFG